MLPDEPIGKAGPPSLAAGGAATSPAAPRHEPAAAPPPAVEPSAKPAPHQTAPPASSAAGHSDGPAPIPAATQEADASESPSITEPSAEPSAEPGEARRRERSRRAKQPNGTAPHEPAQMLDLCELPETYGRDEVGILTKDPQWYFVYWEVTKSGEATAREQLGPSGDKARLVLRLFTTLVGGHPAGPGAGAATRESRELRDVPLPHPHGRKYLEAPRPGAMVRAAVGLLSVEGYFAPIAHSALVRMPLQQAAPQTSVEWLHVLPPRSQGHKRERIVAVPPAVQHEERALPVHEGGPAALGGEVPAAASPERETPAGSSPAPGAPDQKPTEPGDSASPPPPPLGHGSGGLG